MTRPAAIVTAFLCILLCSCSAEKRLNRLIANHPEMARTDTIHDTLYVQQFQTDTTFVSVSGDTVRIDTGRLHIRYVRMKGDTVFLAGKCDPDTVVRTLTFEKIAPTVTVNKVPWWVWVIIGALALAVLIQQFRK